MSYFRTQLEEWLKTIDVKARLVIDVGGGAKPVNDRVKSWDVVHYTVLDNKLEEPTNELTIKDFDLNVSLPADWERTAQVVFCLEVMEYIYDPMTAVRNLYAMTAPGGVLYISFPFVYPMHKPEGADFLRYTEEGVIALLSAAGFKIRDLLPRLARNPDLLKAFYSSDGMHSRRDDTVAHTGYLVVADKE